MFLGLVAIQKTVYYNSKAHYMYVQWNGMELKKYRIEE